MFKRLLFFSALALLLVGCIGKNLEFKVINEAIMIEQTLDEFDISMIEDSLELHYGENIIPLEKADVEVEGDIDLSKVGVHDIKLISKYKTKRAEVPLSISVVDTQPPELHIFEKELLVYTDENITINSDNFLINLTDGINGVINSRLSIEGSYDLKTVGVYPIEIVGIDDSGNETREKINIRVTNIIDEKAHYLYQKANVVAHGKSLIFEDNNESAAILNFDSAFNVFTPNYKEHFFWLSGLTGSYNKKQSGVELKEVEGTYYADYSNANKVSGYKQTKLTIQYEEENYRHYLAESTYEVDGEEVIKNSKFIIRKINDIWCVEEFYMPN